MRFYNPYATPQDPADYREFLSREFRNVKDSMDQVHDLDVNSVSVVPPREGMIRYADGVNWDPLGYYAERGYGKGPYYYDGTNWLPLFHITRDIWYTALATPYTVTGAWTTFLTLNTRPCFLRKLILTASFLCGGTSTNKLLDVSLRYRINSQAPPLDPNYGFSYNLGANLDATTWHSVDMTLTEDTQAYINIVPGQTFYNVAVEVQARANSSSLVDDGYIQVMEA